MAITVTWLRALDFDNLDSLLGKLDYPSISQRLAQSTSNDAAQDALTTSDAK